MEQLFKPKIDLNKDPHLVEYFKRAKDFNPLEHYNIDEVDFQKWVEENFFEHLKPRVNELIIDDSNFFEVFYIKEGDGNFKSRDEAVKFNVLIRQIADTSPYSLIKLIKNETLSIREQEFLDICDLVLPTSDLTYMYGVPIVRIKDRSDLRKKTLIFSGVSVPKMGIILNCETDAENDSVLRHEFTHIIQNYKNLSAQKHLETKDIANFALTKIKQEFEAYITDYCLAKNLLGGIDKPMPLISAFIGIEFKPSKTVNRYGWKHTNDPENQVLLNKAKNIINALENIVPQASPDKLVEINKFIQNANTLDELLGDFDSEGVYKKGLLQFL